MKTRILTSILCLAALAARAQYPAPGPTPLFRGAGLNGSGSLVLGAVADLHTFTPEGFRVSTDTDDTNSLQAAINAACAAAPAKVLLSRVYYISGALTGTVPAGSGITIEGLNRNCGIMTSLATGDVLLFAPSGTPSTSSLSTGLRWMTFKDFFVDSSVTRTSGAAFHVQWSDSTSFINVRIGSFNVTLPGTQYPMYDGIFMDKQSNCSVTYPQIYCSDVGFTTIGASTTPTGYFAFGGYIGGGGYMYGNYATHSIGIHIAGCNGGFELGDFDCGQWGRYSLLCDEALAAGSNHELFIGRVFLDSPQVCSCYIGANSLNILHLHDGWMAGAGIQTGATSDGSPEFGCGLYVQAPQASLHINISSGSHIYANASDGVCVCDCLSMLCLGADIYGNGVRPVTGGGNHGVEIQGGNNVLLVGNNLTGNAGASFITRATDGGTYGGVTSYMIFANDGGGSGYPSGIEENAAARTGNMYAGFTLGGTNYINDGPFPSQFTLPYNETPSTAGVSLGFYTSPRILLSTGTTAQNWEIDNQAGVERHFKNGTVYETLTNTALNAMQNLNIGDVGLPSFGTSYGAFFGGTTAGIVNTYPSGGTYPNVGINTQVTSGGATITALQATPTGGVVVGAGTADPGAGNLAVTTSTGEATVVAYQTSALSASAIDWSLRGPFTKTISANTAFTFANQTSGQEIKVAVTNTGAYTVTWPTVSWPGGTAPTQTTGAHTDIYTFRAVGSTIYGSVTQNY